MPIDSTPARVSPPFLDEAFIASQPFKNWCEESLDFLADVF
jgi:hypothetical protein